MTLLTYTLVYWAICVVLICAFLWFLGRGKDFKNKNDEIFERELRKKIEKAKKIMQTKEEYYGL